jgi:hypothetical protein
MMVARWLGRALLVASYAAPWAWLACFGVFVAAVTVKVGHFPYYSNPDPKHVDGLCVLYLATMLLLMATLASPIVVGGHALIAALRQQRVHAEPVTTAVYLLGLTLFVIVNFGNAFGLGSWLFD